MIDKIASLSGSLSGVGSLAVRSKTAGSMSGGISSQIVNTDYEELNHLPTINGVTVIGDLTTETLKIERGYDARIDPNDQEHLILST